MFNSLRRRKQVMANVRSVCVCLFITSLLALMKCCKSEIGSTVPESWYSANVIKDGNYYAPKPLSEIFSTETDTFSTVNPIIVLPPSSSNLPLLSSSYQTTLAELTGSTLPPLSSLQTIPSTVSSLPTSFQSFPTNPQSFPTSPQSFPTSPQSFPTSPQSFATSLQSFPTTPLPPLTPSQPPVSTVQVLSNTPPAPLNPQNIQYIICPSCAQSPQSTPQSVTIPSAAVTTTPIRVSTLAPPIRTVPCATNGPVQRMNSTVYPFIRIRMYSSKGLAPIVVAPRTTTARPTTTRRPRRNRRNNYDACVDSCGGGRKPICAAPLATRPVNPDLLRGFPSICHMACYNSFKKIQHEKLADGRCGRLRTRIRPLDSKDKIKKDDLNKAQYQVVGGDTVIEFSPVQLT